MIWSNAAARLLGIRIKQLRKDRGLTQENLAHAAGITKNAIQLIESGRGSAREDGPPSNLRLTSLFGLAEALGTSPAELILGLEHPSASVETDKAKHDEKLSELAP
ncbi:helix-turn-helix domain-containing protein [Agreia sp. PsM10]|uniref:helix-turn-helix domain-containing protein n=1 Tax=Agreia sp. PsM10 TaxID=3030533 RepID=UPI00345E2297